MTPERYGIYLPALDPTVGREIAKTRPVVVVSLDVLNRVLDTVVVCPLTTKLHPGWRSRLPVRCAGKNGRDRGGPDPCDQHTAPGAEGGYGWRGRRRKTETSDRRDVWRNLSSEDSRSSPSHSSPAA